MIPFFTTLLPHSTAYPTAGCVNPILPGLSCFPQAPLRTNNKLLSCLATELTNLWFSFINSQIKMWPPILRWGKRRSGYPGYLLWEKGAFANEEIWAVFGVSYSAVSHIVRRVKRQLREDINCQRKRDLINSQFKMWPHAQIKTPISQLGNGAKNKSALRWKWRCAIISICLRD